MILGIKNEYFLNSINRFVFVVETKYISCELGAEFLNIIHMNFMLQNNNHGAIGIGSFEMSFPLLHLYLSAGKVTKTRGPSGQGFACLFVCVLLFPTRLNDAVDWLFVN
jgi:hypothetical protein